MKIVKKIDDLIHGKFMRCRKKSDRNGRAHHEGRKRMENGPFQTVQIDELVSRQVNNDGCRVCSTFREFLRLIVNDETNKKYENRHFQFPPPPIDG